MNKSVQTAQDHPRSRGVYAATPRMAARIVGSSPLARGLPFHAVADGDPVRIIPARAGFTGHTTTPVPVTADHPRSRGVYRLTIVISPHKTGSSPLARGLQRARHRARPRGRIIPARAGFTRGRRNSPAAEKDHPRSRGVYLIARPTINDIAVDHPRSRGVYPGVLGLLRLWGGSSPLARGLLPRLTAAGYQAGDHPRSRGVYVLRQGNESVVGGSSPLARGLPRPRRSTIRTCRIIPARAGFTRRRKPLIPPPWDHPRSRGVYFGLDPDSPVTGGSSPLARGLPEAARDLPLGGRIIPARAGFTVMPRSITAALKDHPRSRGVYSTLFDANWAVMGSSPLARGLPDATNKFKNTLRDHPRSRGVYHPRRTW